MKHEVTAKRLRDALARADMSQRELAEKSGVNEASISQYINGSHKPSNVSAGKMAEVLGVNPVWLIGFDVSMIDKGVHDQLINLVEKMDDTQIARLLAYAQGLTDMGDKK